MIPQMKSYQARLLVIGMVLACTYTSYAQKVIKVEDRMLRDSIGENATRNTKQLGYLTLLRRMTKNTQENVEATEELQYRYQAFLGQTHSTASLAVADAEVEQEAVVVAIGTADHLGDYSFARNLHQTYAEPSLPLEKSEELYQQLIPYDEYLAFTELSSFQANQQARQLNMTALQEMSGRRRLQLATMYQQLADQKIVKADELRAMLHKDGQFSMTESERLELLRRMQEYLLSSQHLKAQADRLIHQASTYSFSKQQAINRFGQARERKVMATTPVF